MYTSGGSSVEYCCASIGHLRPFWSVREMLRTFQRCCVTFQRCCASFRDFLRRFEAVMISQPLQECLCFIWGAQSSWACDTLPYACSCWCSFLTVRSRFVRDIRHNVEIWELKIRCIFYWVRFWHKKTWTAKVGIVSTRPWHPSSLVNCRCGVDTFLG